MGLPTLIGGGIGALSSIFGSNKPQTTSTSFDPATQNYITGMRNTAQGFANQNWGVDPSIQQAMQQLQQYMTQGNLGMGILGGQDPAALAKMIGPGQSALNTIYNQEQGQGLAALQKAATLAGGTGLGGAGNTRAGIPIGSFMSQMGATRAQGTLGLLNQAYQNAGLMANLGMGATQGMGSLGQWLTNLPALQAQIKMGLLNSGLGPVGQTTTIPTTKPNIFSSILGGASIGAGLGGWGNGMAAIQPPPDMGWIPSAATAAANPPSIQ